MATQTEFFKIRLRPEYFATRMPQQLFEACKTASPESLDNLDLMLAAVKLSGWALKFASARLQNMRAVVLQAVENEGTALAYASPELRADREIVIRAVRNDGLAIAHASAALQSDPEIIKIAQEERKRRAKRHPIPADRNRANSLYFVSVYTNPQRPIFEPSSGIGISQLEKMCSL